MSVRLSIHMRAVSCDPVLFLLLPSDEKPPEPVSAKSVSSRRPTFSPDIQESSSSWNGRRLSSRCGPSIPTPLRARLSRGNRIPCQDTCSEEILASVRAVRRYRGSTPRRSSTADWHLAILGSLPSSQTEIWGGTMPYVAVAGSCRCLFSYCSSPFTRSISDEFDKKKSRNYGVSILTVKTEDLRRGICA